MSEPLIMSCAVCARVLVTVEEERGGVPRYRYEHDPLDQPEDHPPVPVARDQVQTRSRCDFCTGDGGPDGPRWLLPAATFGDPASAYSVEAWAACDECAALLRRDQWTRLRARCVRMRQAGMSDVAPAALDAAMGKMLRELRRHITGALVPRDQPPPPTTTAGR